MGNLERYSGLRFVTPIWKSGEVVIERELRLPAAWICFFVSFVLIVWVEFVGFVGDVFNWFGCMDVWR